MTVRLKEEKDLVYLHDHVFIQSELANTAIGILSGSGDYN
ncbi:MAG: hypothetical protein BMS9Abin30_1204 [Gammaproteobacteria bacterium]|nr:MAG: hypothetical protein BMS9Abin30_1204 [Gammaproteobacteria bacterium]